MAKIPAGFQNGTDNRHSKITVINGNAARKNCTSLYFIIVCVWCIKLQNNHT